MKPTLLMSEADLLRAVSCGRAAQVVAGVLVGDCRGDCIAHLLGYRSMHATPLRTARGWATPTRGDMGKGWPDLILAGRGRLIAAELKASHLARHRPTAEQLAVLHWLAECGAESYVWTPAELDDGTIWRTLMDGPG